MRFPEGTDLFEERGSLTLTTKWPVEALFVCGDRERCPEHSEGVRREVTSAENPTGSVSAKSSDELAKEACTWSTQGGRDKTQPVRVSGMKDDNLRIRARGEIGDTFQRELTVLVDTGAQVDLIRRGLVPEHLTEAVTVLLRLVMANTQPMKGGKREARLDLIFMGFVEDTKKRVEVREPTVLYEADITEDVILSYSWLGARNFDVYPRQHGFKGRQGQTRVWVPGISSEEVYGVSAHPMTPREVGGTGQRKALVLTPVREGVVPVLEQHGYQVVIVNWGQEHYPEKGGSVPDWRDEEAYPREGFELMVAAPWIRERRDDRKSVLEEFARECLQMREHFEPEKWWCVLDRTDATRLVEFSGFSFVDLDGCQFRNGGSQEPLRAFGDDHILRVPTCVCDRKTCIWLTNPVERRKEEGAHVNRRSGHSGKAKRNAARRLPPDLVAYLSGLDGGDPNSLNKTGDRCADDREADLRGGLRDDSVQETPRGAVLGHPNTTAATTPVSSVSPGDVEVTYSPEECEDPGGGVPDGLEETRRVLRLWDETKLMQMDFSPWVTFAVSGEDEESDHPTRVSRVGEDEDEEAELQEI